MVGLLEWADIRKRLTAWHKTGETFIRFDHLHPDQCDRIRGLGFIVEMIVENPPGSELPYFIVTN